MAKGAFIAIESPIAHYAASQAEQLRNRLEAAGYEVAYFSFPQTGEPSSYFADRYADGSYGSDVVPYAGSLFYALDHFEAGDAIRQALSEGKVVLAHRYLGANMVEQGVKLPNPQERRGYFLWLDNLESQVLKAPRPDRSFILSVSADRIAELSNDDQSAVAVNKQNALNSELCDLYPKDFIRVDSERNGKLLDSKLIEDILWTLTEPLLPVLETSPASTSTGVPYQLTKLTDSPIPTTAVDTTVSRLLADQLINQATTPYTLITPDYIQTPQKVSTYLIPTYFDKQLAIEYRTTMDHLFENYRLIYKKLVDYLAATNGDASKATTTAANVLPLAATCQLTTLLSDQQLESWLVTLLSNEQPEAWSLGQNLLKAHHALIPNPTMNTADIAYRASRQRVVRKHTHKLPQVHAPNQTTIVKLLAVSPRNEFDLIPYMLYDQTSLSLAGIEQAIQQWPFERKQAVFEAYCNQRASQQETPGAAFAQAHYSWDVLTDYQSLSELMVSDVASLTLQALTPRYGYQVPLLVEQAGLTDLYEDSFDRSMQLYSDLQQASCELEAQIVTLMGHKQRALFTCNGQQLVNLTEQAAKPLVQDIMSELDENHPLIAKMIILPKTEKSDISSEKYTASI